MLSKPIEYLLGVDVGTTACKAVVFDLAGNMAGAGTAEYRTRFLSGNGAEQDPDDWWRAVCESIGAALAAAPGDGRVGAVCVSAQAPTLLPVDGNGDPLRPALIWMDRRADDESRELEAAFGFEEIIRRTGNRPDPFFIAAKLRWFHRHEPEIAARTRCFLQINGFINHRLTGNFTLDRAHAGLLQVYNPSEMNWCPEIVDWCGFSPDHFPAPSDGWAVIGEVSGSAAAATGLAAGTPVAAGTVDGAAAALEAGVINPGTAAEMTGTSTVLMMPARRVVPHPAFISMPHALDGRVLSLAAMASTGACLKWFRDELGNAEREQAEQDGLNAYDLLTAQAAESAPGANGVLFLPYMMGERSPHWHTEARGVFFGLRLATGKQDLLRALLEGAVFALRENVEIARQSGLTVDRIRSVGGGAQSALWNQIKADVLGLPVEIPETSVGAPFGDAILAGLACGALTDAEAFLDSTVRIERVFHPEKELAEGYSHLYERFRKLYRSLKGEFDSAADPAPFPSV